MTDQEKVLKGLICCSQISGLACHECPYNEENCDNIPPVCTGKLANDALMLLKENNECENCAIAIEDRQLVIRCKNCRYYWVTDKTSFCSKNDGRWSYNDFCSKGEKR